MTKVQVKIQLYIDNIGEYDKKVDIKDDVVYLLNAPFCGIVPICEVKDGEVVPYF